MHHLIALVATLLLSASALAHAPRASVGALPFGEPTRIEASNAARIEQAEHQAEAAAPEPYALENLSRQQKTAHRAHARQKHAESARASALMHCLVLESWLFGWKCASGEVIDGDPMRPATLNEYLAFNGNPTVYVDPDGRLSFLTTLRDKFNETDRILRGWAMESDSALGYVTASVARGVISIGSVPSRATNLASDVLGAGLSAPGWTGVREEGTANLAPYKEILKNPSDTVFAAYDRARETTADLYAGDRGAGSDVFSFGVETLTGSVLTRAGRLAPNSAPKPAAPTMSSSMSSAELDAALDNVQPKAGAPVIAQLGEGSDGNVVLSVPNTPKSFEPPYKGLSQKRYAAIRDRIDARTATREEYEQFRWNRRFNAARREAVADFWIAERQRLQAGESGTRNWSDDQRQAILAEQTPRAGDDAIEGHHRYSARAYPQLARDSENIYPVTRPEHVYRWHGGSTRNATHGEPLNPDYPEEF